MNYQTWREQLSSTEVEQLQAFFEDFNTRCRLSKLDKTDMREDFERAILFLVKDGLSLDEVLERLSMRNLGGFYARPPVMWFPLDDAAKIYPLSMAHGNMSVFRLSVTLRETVVPELLQMALTFTIKRFPSFATTLKKGVFWHYLDSTKRRFPVERERGIPCQPLKVSSSGSTAFRVLYYENRISMEFFHMLTDGTGAMTFLKVLTAEYLRLRGVDVTPDETLWDANADPTADEAENAFANVPTGGGSSGFVEKNGVQMTGRLSRNNPCRVIHMRMPVTELKAAAERYGVTVTAYMLTLMFFSMRSATDELRGECSIQVPVNMRKFYPSRTVRNFSMYCGIRERLEEMDSVPAMAQRIAEQLRSGSAREPLTEKVTAAEHLVNTLKYVPLFIKQPIARFVYSFLNDNAYSNIFSNLGVVRLPAPMAAEIEAIDFALGTYAKKRAACAAVSVNNTMSFTVTKNIVDPSFEEKMYELLKADGVHVTAEGSMLYED